MNLVKVSRQSAKELSSQRLQQLAELYRMVADWHIQEAATSGDNEATIDVPTSVWGLVTKSLEDDGFIVSTLKVTGRMYIQWGDLFKEHIENAFDDTP